MPDIIMPRLSDSMQEGTILRWLKANADEVTRDEELLEIETDKATMTYEAETTGILSIIVGEGKTVPVGAVIGRLEERSASPDAAVDAASMGTTSSGNGGAHEEPAAVGPPEPLHSGRASKRKATIKASPVARRTAERLEVALAGIIGSGPGGRILKADVVAARASGADTVPVPVTSAPPPAGAPVAQPGALASTESGFERESATEELSRTQILIARRMAESRATVPDFALQVDVEMGAPLELCRRLKELLDSAPSVNDIIVKAVAAALRRHPRANGSYRDGHFELHSNVNVGVAVATADALVVPTVRDADGKSLGAIAAETRRLIERVRSRTITPAELAGGTFTVSNLGMYGIDRFEGIINPPQAAVLCAGSIRERPVAVDGQVEVHPVMTLTLACDHRILYGADAAQFLTDIRRFLEEPLAAL